MTMIEFYRSGQKFHRSTFDCLIHLNDNIFAIQSIYTIQVSLRGTQAVAATCWSKWQQTVSRPLENRRHAINTHQLHVKLCYRVV